MPDPINPISIVDGDTHINKYPGKKIYIGGDEYFPFELPIGTLLMYNGSGIANAGSRSTKLGDEGGDTIDVSKLTGDWYVCNGNASTPNLINKFVRAQAASGSTGGADTHTLTVGQMPVHKHSVLVHRNLAQSGYTYQGTKVFQAKQYNYTSDATNTGSIQNKGGGGAHENKPAYYSLIFIIRMA